MRLFEDGIRIWDLYFTLAWKHILGIKWLIYSILKVLFGNDEVYFYRLLIKYFIDQLIYHFVYIIYKILENSENAQHVFLKCKMTSPPGFITLTKSKINVLSYMPRKVLSHLRSIFACFKESLYCQIVPDSFSNNGLSNESTKHFIFN